MAWWSGATRGCRLSLQPALHAGMCVLLCVYRLPYLPRRHLHAIKSPLAEFKLLQRSGALICIWYLTHGLEKSHGLLLLDRN